MSDLLDKVVGANAGRARGHNRQMVLGRIQSAERIGRAEIARASGLSTQAVSNIIADLLADGLIVEQGHRSVSRGVPVAQYSLNPAGGFAAGIEIRPDAVFGGLLNLCGEPVVKRRAPLGARDRAGVVEAVRHMRAEILEAAECDPAKLLGLGVVMPGPFGRTGLRGGASELDIWDETPPATWLSEALGTPVLVENDANAAAIAERVRGVAQGLGNYAFIYFGSGLGLGVVSGGRLVAGGFGNAGEIGTLQVPSAGALVMLEDMVSRRSLAAALGPDGANATVADLARLHSENDLQLTHWLEAAIEPLSAAIATVENLFDPQTIILGGAMPDNMLDHLVAHLRLPERSVSNRIDRAQPRLMRGASGRMTATFGAAALVVNHAFTPQIAAAVLGAR